MKIRNNLSKYNIILRTFKGSSHALNEVQYDDFACDNLLLLNPPKKIHLASILAESYCFIFITTLSTKGEDGHQTFLSILPR